MALNTCMVFKVWYGRSCLEAKISEVEKQRREMGLNAMGKGITMPLAWVKVKEVLRASSDAQEEHPPDLHCFFFFFEQEVRKIRGKTVWSSWVNARGSCSSCSMGVAQAALLSPSFLYFLSLFLQTWTNLPPVSVHVAMAIGEVLHGPSANGSSPA